MIDFFLFVTVKLLKIDHTFYQCVKSELEQLSRIFFFFFFLPRLTDMKENHVVLSKFNQNYLRASFTKFLTPGMTRKFGNPLDN